MPWLPEVSRGSARNCWRNDAGCVDQRLEWFVALRMRELPQQAHITILGALCSDTPATWNVILVDSLI